MPRLASPRLVPCSDIFFPYSVDFRGRAYPIPPHLSHIGSDLCRGMMRFARGRPLGERGFFWLLVHFSNLMGVDKCSLQERYEYGRAKLDEIVAAVDEVLAEQAREFPHAGPHAPVYPSPFTPGPAPLRTPGQEAEAAGPVGSDAPASASAPASTSARAEEKGAGAGAGGLSAADRAVRAQREREREQELQQRIAQRKEELKHLSEKVALATD